MQKNNLFWKDIVYIIVLFTGVAVMWGMTQTKIEYLEKAIEEKADSELINTKLDYIAEKVSNIEEILESRK